MVLHQMQELVLIKMDYQQARHTHGLQLQVQQQDLEKKLV